MRPEASVAESKFYVGQLIVIDSVSEDGEYHPTKGIYHMIQIDMSGM